MLWSIVFALISFSTVLSKENTTSICPANDFCVYIQRSNERMCSRITFDSFIGWFGLGVGTGTMYNSDIYVTSKEPESNVFRRFTGIGNHNRPRINDVQNYLEINDDPFDGIGKGNESITFCIDVDQELVGEVYIWAWKRTTKPFDDLSFPFHGPNFGAFAQNEMKIINQGQQPPKSSAMTFETAAALHGLLMWVAWMVCPLLGIISAGYFKQLGHVWFISHWCSFGLCALLSTASFILIIASMNPPHFQRALLLEDFHIKFGLALILLMVVQIILGICADRYYQPGRESVPLVDQSHWWTGRLLVLGSVSNVTIGMYLFRTKGFLLPVPFEIVHWTFIGVVIVTFIILEYHYYDRIHIHGKLGVQSEDEEEQDPLM